MLIMIWIAPKSYTRDPCTKDAFRIAGLFWDFLPIFMSSFILEAETVDDASDGEFVFSFNEITLHFLSFCFTFKLPIEWTLTLCHAGVLLRLALCLLTYLPKRLSTQKILSKPV